MHRKMSKDLKKQESKDSKKNEIQKQIQQFVRQSTLYGFADGGCQPNPGFCGSGVVLYEGNKEIERRSIALGQGSNNVGELSAVLLFLYMVHDYFETLKEEISIPNQYSEIHLFSDSKYAQNVLFGNWQPTKNQELIQAIKNVLNRLKDHYHIQCTCHWVPGHSGVDGNEIANDLSTEAVNDSKKDESASIENYQNLLKYETTLFERKIPLTNPTESKTKPEAVPPKPTPKTVPKTKAPVQKENPPVSKPKTLDEKKLILKPKLKKEIPEPKRSLYDSPMPPKNDSKEDSLVSPVEHGDGSKEDSPMPPVTVKNESNKKIKLESTLTEEKLPKIIPTPIVKKKMHYYATHADGKVVELTPEEAVQFALFYPTVHLALYL